MAIEEHSEFTWPTDPSATLWRYLDLPKYLSMLESNALFFCRLDMLNDPFEGSRTKITIENEAGLMTEVLRNTQLSEGEIAAHVAGILENSSRFARAMTKWCAINC